MEKNNVTKKILSIVKALISGTDDSEDKIKLLSKKSAEDRFLYGGCGSFALELQNKIGGDLYGISQNGKIYHVFIKKGDKSFDVKGIRSPVEMALGIFGTYEGITELPLQSMPSNIKIKSQDRLLAKRYIDSLHKTFK